MNEIVVRHWTIEDVRRAIEGYAGVTGTEGWFENERERLYLVPDEQNPDGDTLAGMTMGGQAVSVYLPESALAKASEAPVQYTEPPTCPTWRSDTKRRRRASR